LREQRIARVSFEKEVKAMSRERRRRSRMKAFLWPDGETRKVIESMLDGQHWLFLCFTPERYTKLCLMFAECQMFPECRGVTRSATKHMHFPQGVLWNKEECHAYAVPKGLLPSTTLAAGLRKHFGYEYPEPTSGVFTLGVTAEDDAALSRVGLFGNKKSVG
jgi:hypothetical protein